MKREAIVVGLSAIIFLAACKEHKKPDVEVKQPVCITDSLAKMISLDTVKMAAVKDELSLSSFRMRVCRLPRISTVVKCGQ